MSRSRALLAGALLAFASCTGAGRSVEPLPMPAIAPVPDGTEVASNAGRYLVVFRPEPAVVPTGEPFALRVWVRDPSGARLEDVALVVDASMPHHQHGMNTRPVLRRVEDGGFRVEGLLFHMPGEWTVTFDVERGGITERAQTILDVD